MSRIDVQRAALVEVIAKHLYEKEYPRYRWAAKAMPEHEREYYRRLAISFIRNMGGEAELFALCEAIIATSAVRLTGSSAAGETGA